MDYRFPSLCFLAFIVMQLQVYHSLGSQVFSVSIGSVFRGSTIGAQHLVDVDGYDGGQALFKLSVPEESLELEGTKSSALMVSVSTCSKYTAFDTKLYVFESNPLHSKGIHKIIISTNDNDCGPQSTVEVVASKRNDLYFLLTGNRGAEGIYELTVSEVQMNETFSTPWNLDRIDQRYLPLDGRFIMNEAGQRVFIYILDSGVRASHTDFLEHNGSSRVKFGTDVVERLAKITDETGHGTHVAALAAGKRFGVAKRAEIISVRVLDRNNAGLITQLVEGLVWTKEHIQGHRNLPAVIVMSVSTAVSEVLNSAVDRVASTGISVVTAAGNQGKNSCLASPSSAKSAITVAATNSRDGRLQISNWGECVDIYAPGENIKSAWHTGDYALKVASGTSASCPLAAGAVAVLLEQNPLLNSEEVREVLRATGTLAVKRNEPHPAQRLQRDGLLQKEELGKLLYVRPIPVVLSGRHPLRGNMFLYLILGLGSSDENNHLCFLSAHQLDIVRSTLSRALGKSLKTSVALTLCCMHKSAKGCDNGDLFSGNRAIVRAMTAEHHAHSAFESLMAFCQEKRAILRMSAALDIKISVVAEPWVVDSRGYTYWAAPALVRTAKKGLSTTLVVITSILAALLAILLFALVAFLIRRTKRIRRQKQQDHCEEKARQYELQKQQHADLCLPESLRPGTVFARDMRRTNSELDVDILKNLSPSAVIPTPCSKRTEGSPQNTTTPLGFLRGSFLNLFSSSTSPACDEQTNANNEADQERGQQPNENLFLRLMTPRRERKSTAENPSLAANRSDRLPRVLSFGPTRGALVEPTLLSPTEGCIDDQMTAHQGTSSDA